MCPAQAGIYLSAGAEAGGVAALVSGKADGRICQEPCFLKIYDGPLQDAARYGKRALGKLPERPYG